MKNKVVLIVTALCMIFALCITGCAKAGTTAAPAGKVLNIYCWNEEFQARFKNYFEAKGLVPADVTVNWVMTPNQNNAYQNKLDEALRNQADAAADDKIDLFLVEADYALKYADTDYTLDVYKDIGLTPADTAKQYKYTKDIMTDSKGILKGVSWQACPGGFIYRRSIAKDVLGTDDPDEVQKALASWDLFDVAAEKAKAKGYAMVSGYDDDFRVFSDNTTSPWVKDGKIVVDASIKRWVEQTKAYTDNGYNNKASLWSAESWQGGMAQPQEGIKSVFGYFGPAWFLDFCLNPNVDTDGDWAFCKGPQGFSWGGTWICGAAGSDNIALINSIMKTITCDATTMTAIAKDMGDFTNNEDAMAAVAVSDYKNEFLGGQNHVKFFLDSAKSIDKSSMSMYDQTMTEKIQLAMKDYFDGNATIDEAWAHFYTMVIEKHPELSK